MGLEYGEFATDHEPSLEKVTKVKDLLTILQKRLPKSCNVFNMAQNHHKFQNEMHFYKFESNREIQHKDPWIVATYTREDYGTDINISAPRDHLSSISSFKDALLTSGIISWNDRFIFAATDTQISSMTQECIQESTGKSPFSCKNLMFYATPQSHPLNHPIITSNMDGSTIELKRLDAHTGSKFLVDNWPFAKSGSLSYIRKLIERNESSGVYVDGELVAGAALNGSGMITMLHTLKEHRHKGYAQLCMNYLVRSLLQNNVIPCCTVEMNNTASLSLQRKIGMKVSHEASYITKSQS